MSSEVLITQGAAALRSSGKVQSNRQATTHHHVEHVVSPRPQSSKRGRISGNQLFFVLLSVLTVLTLHRLHSRSIALDATDEIDTIRSRPVTVPSSHRVHLTPEARAKLRGDTKGSSKKHHGSTSHAERTSAVPNHAETEDEEEEGEPAAEPVWERESERESESESEREPEREPERESKGDKEEDEEEDEEEESEGSESEREIPVGAIKGPWRWTGDVWRRIDPSYEGEMPQNNPLSWFDRRTVQRRLNFDKYIHCSKTEGELPGMEGLPVRSEKLDVDDFVVNQHNYERLGKGENANRTERIKNWESLPVDGRSVLEGRNWGACAVVGNSGILRLTEFARAIDSHDTVLRLNQAPTYDYARRVGHKTTHRLLNKLWTRTYRNGQGMKKGQVLPMEQDMEFVVSRASGQEYELLVDYLEDVRPDVKVLYLSSRATSMAKPLLTAYRERLCKAGYGPYKGLNVPSSGYVAIQILQRLCDTVTVYGFGVSGMGNCKTCGASKTGEEKGPTEKFQYHYYKGVGSRHVGDDVHSFDTEEKLLQQLGAENYINFCTYEPPLNNTHNWQCGCASPDIEECRPYPRLRPWNLDDDADEDCGPRGCDRLFRMGPLPKGAVSEKGDKFATKESNKKKGGKKGGRDHLL